MDAPLLRVKEHERVGSRECGVLFHAKNENQQWCREAF